MEEEEDANLERQVDSQSVASLPGAQAGQRDKSDELEIKEDTQSEWWPPFFRPVGAQSTIDCSLSYLPGRLTGEYLMLASFATARAKRRRRDKQSNLMKNYLD